MKISDENIETMRQHRITFENRGKATIKKKIIKNLDYNIHATVDHKRNIFVCKVCLPNRPFTQWRNMERHMKNFHTQEKFFCLWSKCPSWSERWDNMKRHITDMHKKLFPVENVDFERREVDTD